jgi:transposase
MLSMQPVHIIRHKVLVEGLSVQQVAQDLGLSRTTVYKYLKESTPGKVAIRTTAKQRLTAARLHRVSPRFGHPTVTLLARGRTVPSLIGLAPA